MTHTLAVFKPFTQSRQDDMYYRLVKFNRQLFNNLQGKAKRKQLTDWEIVVLEQVSNLLNDCDTY